jgi:hypothetical protein
MNFRKDVKNNLLGVIAGRIKNELQYCTPKKSELAVAYSEKKVDELYNRLTK